MRTLGIIFSSRLQSLLLCMLGLWILFFAGTAAWQVVSAYLGSGYFDVPIGASLRHCSRPRERLYTRAWTRAP